MRFIMTTEQTQKIGRKKITSNIVSGFSGALTKLESQTPEIEHSATSLIKEHADQINVLLEKGYKTKQIAEILKTELDLNISPSLIQRALRTAE